MRNDAQAVHRRHACALAIRQAQAPANRLLYQRACVCGAQRHDGVEVGHVPALLEHVHVDHDFGGLVHTFHGQQLAHHLLFLRAALAAVHLDHLVAVAPGKKFVRLQMRQQGCSVCGVPRNHQHEGLDLFDSVAARVGLQLHLGGLMHAHAVAQLHALQLFGRQGLGVKVALGHHRRLFHKAVFHGPRQGVLHHHVLERHRSLGGFDKRRGRQLQAQHGLQVVDGTQARRGAVAVRLVHQQHQIGQAGQVVKVALADVFREPLDARCLPPAHL